MRPLGVIFLSKYFTVLAVTLIVLSYSTVPIRTVTRFEQSIIFADTPNMYTRPVISEGVRGGSL